VEIADSKKIIEVELNEPVRMFSYPGGAFDEDIKRMVREEGFDCAVTVRRGTNNRESDLYELRRIGME
jgi:peptidoglycan/xylan/chitin deacetylase (PgdA/CDA1 family)